MRLYRGTYGSSSPYTTYKNILLSDDNSTNYTISSITCSGACNVSGLLSGANISTVGNLSAASVSISGACDCTGALTAGSLSSTSISGNMVAGSISGCDVTIGSGVTLDCSAGALTLSTAQKAANMHISYYYGYDDAHTAIPASPTRCFIGEKDVGDYSGYIFRIDAIIQISNAPNTSSSTWSTGYIVNDTNNLDQAGAFIAAGAYYCQIHLTYVGPLTTGIVYVMAKCNVVSCHQNEHTVLTIQRYQAGTTL